MRAMRPFEVVHCDHYLCDIFVLLFLANGFQYAMRPWLTVLRDSATKLVLGIWIGFRSPSRRSVSMALRNCARRWGRWPESIVVDNGKEFHSVYFSTLAAATGMNIVFRPSAHGRYGQEAERIFGEIKELLLSHLTGYVESIQNLRAVSPSHHPQNLAVIEAATLFGELQNYINWTNARLLDTEVESHQAKFDRLQGLAPYSGIPAEVNDRFLIQTAVESRDYKVSSGGIHRNDQHFWNPKMESLLRSNKYENVEVREEPENPHRIYVRIGNFWMAADCGKQKHFELKSEVSRRVEAALLFDTAEARKIADDDSLKAQFQIINRLESSPRAPQSAAPAIPEQPQPKHQPSWIDDVEPLETTTW